MSASRAISVVIALCLGGLLAFLTWTFERTSPQRLDLKSAAVVLGSWLAISGVAHALSKRIVFAASFAAMSLLLLAATSLAKYRYLNGTLHALDFYFYSGRAELGFLLQHFPRIVTTACSVLLLSIAVLVLCFALDRRSSYRALPLLVLCGLAVTCAFIWRGERSRLYHFSDAYHVSAFPASWPEALGVALRGGLLESTSAASSIKHEHAGQDPPPSDRPDIIMVLHESAFPISIYPLECSGADLPRRLYTSADGSERRLTVETFGGATWLSEYGLMLGISTYYFGGVRNFLGTLLIDRVRDSFVGQLKLNGYYVEGIYPSSGAFANTRNFYRSLGLDHILDRSNLGASSDKERDAFYYSKLLERLREHVKNNAAAPFFALVWTMLTHSPYDTAALPNQAIDGLSCAAGPEWTEYVRRLLIAERDLDWLRQELQRDFPGRQLMIVGFGDHQPFLAKTFLSGELTNTQNFMVIPKTGSLGYQTFFRITGVNNFEPDLSATPKSAAIPYLGNIVLRAARLRKGPLYEARDLLAEACAYRYADCPDQGLVLGLHRQMIEQGAVTNR